MSARLEAKPLIHPPITLLPGLPGPRVLPLKIESTVRNGRSRARRGRLSDQPLHPARVISAMNANVALLDVPAEAAPSAETLMAVNLSLQGRERLLVATARA